MDRDRRHEVPSCDSTGLHGPKKWTHGHPSVIPDVFRRQVAGRES
jgi:hypothetical protein